MRKIYLIILGPNVDKDILIQKIRELGDVFIVFGNNIFVSSTLNTAQEVYDSIVTSGMEEQTSVILDLGTRPGYWGYTKKELWAWINDHSTRTGQ